MRVFDQILLGSSYYSIGYASIRESCLIIERTQLADPVYGGTLCGFSASFSDNWEKETKALYRYFEENGAIKNGKLNILLSETLLCSFKCANILFGTDVLDMNGVSITVINNGGLEKLGADKIVDTREKSACSKLNILCKGSLSESAFSDSRFEITVSDAFEDDEKIITFKAKDEINLLKMNAIEYLCKKFEKSENKIVLCAYLMHGEQTFASPFDAYDAGVKEARKNDLHLS